MATIRRNYIRREIRYLHGPKSLNSRETSPETSPMLYELKIDKVNDLLLFQPWFDFARVWPRTLTRTGWRSWSLSLTFTFKSRCHVRRRECLTQFDTQWFKFEWIRKFIENEIEVEERFECSRGLHTRDRRPCAEYRRLHCRYHYIFQGWCFTVVLTYTAFKWCISSWFVTLLENKRLL